MQSNVRLVVLKKLPNYETIDSPGATDSSAEALAASSRSSSSPSSHSPSLKEKQNQSKLHFILPT